MWLKSICLQILFCELPTFAVVAAKYLQVTDKKEREAEIGVTLSAMQFLSVETFRRLQPASCAIRCASSPRFRVISTSVIYTVKLTVQLLVFKISNLIKLLLVALSSAIYCKKCCCSNTLEWKQFWYMY